MVGKRRVRVVALLLLIGALETLVVLIWQKSIKVGFVGIEFAF
jgi:hypothetical protein